MILAAGALLMAAVDTVMERYHIECFMVVLLWFLERERTNVFLEPRGHRNPYHGKVRGFSIGSFAICAVVLYILRP
jgi:hypothetical protein